jgi:hypothetical protein
MDLPSGESPFRGRSLLGIGKHSFIPTPLCLLRLIAQLPSSQGFCTNRRLQKVSAQPYRLEESLPWAQDRTHLTFQQSFSRSLNRKKRPQMKFVLLHSPSTAEGNIQRCSSSRVYLPTVRCNGERAPSGNKIRCRIRTGPPIRPVWIHRSFVKRFPFQSWLDIIPLTTKAILGNLSECASQLRAPHNGRPRRLSA